MLNFLLNTSPQTFIFALVFLTWGLILNSLPPSLSNSSTYFIQAIFGKVWYSLEMLGMCMKTDCCAVADLIRVLGPLVTCCMSLVNAMQLRSRLTFCSFQAGGRNMMQNTSFVLIILSNVHI